MSSQLTELQKKQIQQAEELLFEGPVTHSFAKDLFMGRFRTESIMPYPKQSADANAVADDYVAKVREFCRSSIDARAIDIEEDIPTSVIRGLGDIGVLGMTISKEYGGRGLNQQTYCRVMEVIGGHCASTGVFVNAHHSIGLRALELFGTTEQKETWLPGGAAGEQIAAFALTETEAGSDASNVQTQATPSEDGKGYVLNGHKRYITNGGIAQMLTVMARTPDDKDPDGKVTAFLVTPDMPGFEVLEQRMEKTGIRGTATGRMQFNNVFVPKENILGPIGKGLRVALTVLDFGRTTFGASCTGVAKFCLERMVHRANTRRQFGKSLGEFELVKNKIAEAAADTFAMESATYHTAAMIDSGAEDFMVETAMLKVFASDRLWRIVNDALQIWGGAGFFTDQPFERMMRDARLNLIGEGANDVLRCFVSMVGFRGLGEQLQGVMQRPWTATKLLRTSPSVPVHHEKMSAEAGRLGKQIGKFVRACQSALIKHREAIMDRQFVQARLGDIATELYMASCVYSRMTSLHQDNTMDDDAKQRLLETGRLYLKIAAQRNQSRFTELKSNFDDETNQVADTWLRHEFAEQLPTREERPSTESQSV